MLLSYAQSPRRLARAELTGPERLIRWVSAPHPRGMLGDSSTVEQRTLTPLILVRIQVPQPHSQKFPEFHALAKGLRARASRSPRHWSKTGSQSHADRGLEGEARKAVTEASPGPRCCGFLTLWRTYPDRLRPTLRKGLIRQPFRMTHSPSISLEAAVETAPVLEYGRIAVPGRRLFFRERLHEARIL